MPQLTVPSLAERSPSMTARRDRGIARFRRGSSSRRRSRTTVPDPDYPSQARAVEQRAGVRRSLDRTPAACSPSARPRPSPASTSTAASASARPTCSPRSGSSRPGAPTSARSSSTPPWSAPSATPPTVKLLSGASFIAIDEFELDDPGDTMMMTRLLGELVGGRHPHRRDLEHPAERPRRGPVRGRRLPARDPGALRPLRDRAHRRPRLPPPRCRGPRGRARRRRVRRGRHRGGRPRRRSPRTRSTPSCSTWRPCTRRATSSSSTGSPAIGIDGRARAARPDRRAAFRRARRPAVRRAGARAARPACRSTGLRRRDARRRLPQEVPARDLAAHRADVARARSRPLPQRRCGAARAPR